jgi:hypothetical protein
MTLGQQMNDKRKTALKRLKELRLEADSIDYSWNESEKLKKWQLAVESALRHSFGDKSTYLSEFDIISWFPQVVYNDMPRQEWVDRFMHGLSESKAVMSAAVQEAEDYGIGEEALDKQPDVAGQCVFIGHGRDQQWRDVAEFVRTRLKLPIEEFNHEPPAGLTTQQRINEMLDKATFALLLMTAEDEHADSSKHARENVIHEIGRAQQKLGSRRAIILLEVGCREFSNIIGVNEIRFPKGYINATFEEIRRVLEREGILRP